MYTGFNHVAFITNDMDKTVRFYRDLLGMPLTVCIGTEEFKHYFFQLTPYDAVAFFSYDEANELKKKRAGVPTSEQRGFDHISIGVNTKAELFELKDRLEAAGIEVEGAVDHAIVWSIYFFDPNNIALEISWQNLQILKPPMMADSKPTQTACEGSAPQAGHWTQSTTRTPDEQQTASPGAGASARARAINDGVARSIKDSSELASLANLKNL